MPGTVVIGGGVIGLSCAFYLHQRGVKVTILDAGPPEQAASHGNAGWITPSLAAPVPAPGLLSTSLRWMLQPDSPLYVKPRFDPDFMRWLYEFWRKSNRRDYEAGLAAIGEFGRKSLAQTDDLLAAGVKFEAHQTGLLFAYRDHATLERDYRDLDLLMPFGYSGITLLDGNSIREVEPALVPGLAGGYHIVQERHVRPDTLVTGLRDWLTEAGVDIRQGVSVTGFEQQGRQIRGLRTTAGPVATEAVVVAAGVWTTDLMRQVDVRVPITMGKGYSMDYVPSPLPEPVTHAMYLHEARVALTPLEGRLRLAGTMELSGLNHYINPRRVEAISRAASEILRGWPHNAKPATVWTGGRPLTPDGLPVIGMAPGFTNLAIASGHSMLGVTLATVTGEAIADLLTTGVTPPTLEPFRASRFRWL